MEKLNYKDELKNFLDGEGRLKSYPSKSKQKLYALFYLATKFETGVRYSEKEVNHILRNWHNFEYWAMLRRDLYDRGFFGRELNGAVYWLEDVQPTFADFGFER